VGGWFVAHPGFKGAAFEELEQLQSHIMKKKKHDRRERCVIHAHLNI
jgi:hypothetical protein